MRMREKKALAALAIVLVMASAVASPSFAGAKTTHTINGVQWRELTAAEIKMIPLLEKMRNKRQLPPARFDYFNPDVIVARVPVKDVLVNCHALGTSRTPLSCAYRAGLTPRYKKCLIILPEGSPYQAILLRHEMGHCNGWPGTHPD